MDRVTELDSRTPIRMTDRELRDLTGGAPRRELQPLEMDMSLFTELRGRDIGKEPGIKP